MELAAAQDMREMDRKTCAGISSRQLMKQAAAAMYSILQQQFQNHEKVLIICGSGNNGGDGYALALQMSERFDVQIFKVEEPAAEDAVYYHDLAQRQSIVMHTELPALEAYDLLIDAMFGTGLNRALQGKYATVVHAMHESHICTVAVDIPSGVHADTGQILEEAVRADMTVTFQFAKRGMYLYPGYEYCGQIHICDIGIKKEDQLLQQPIHILDHAYIASCMPRRSSYSHKGTYGKVLMIGGSSAMHGAVTLAADSALHSGIGTLTLLIPESIRLIVSMKLTEAMLITVPDDHGWLAQSAVEILQEKLLAYDIIAIGCGMGREPACLSLVACVLAAEQPCVLDADALYLLGQHMELLDKRKTPLILTPHIKEFSYLTNRSVQEIQQDLIGSALAFSQRYPQVVLVLKDAHTLIVYEGKLCLNIRGNDALAKGGSGDVLLGLITGLYAQTHNAWKAANAGVYIHALSGEYASLQQSSYTVQAHEYRKMFDRIFQELTLK